MHRYLVVLCLIPTLTCSGLSSDAPLSINQTGPIKVVVTIPVSVSPDALSGIRTSTDLLARIGNLSPEEKKRIAEMLSSGFITAIRLENKSGETSSFFELPVGGSVIMSGSIRARFGPAQEIEPAKLPPKPNK